MEGRLAAVEKQLEHLLAQQPSQSSTEAGKDTPSKANSEKDGPQAEAPTALNASASPEDMPQAGKQHKQSNGEQEARESSMSERKGAGKATQP